MNPEPIRPMCSVFMSRTNARTAEDAEEVFVLHLQEPVGGMGAAASRRPLPSARAGRKGERCAFRALDAASFASLVVKTASSACSAAMCFLHFLGHALELDRLAGRADSSAASASISARRPSAPVTGTASSHRTASTKASELVAIGVIVALQEEIEQRLAPSVVWAFRNAAQVVARRLSFISMPREPNTLEALVIAVDRLAGCC